MTIPVFCDFLRPAGEHISAAVSGADDLCDDAERAAIRELGRASATLARYFADLIPPEEYGPARSTLTVERRALLEARAAMRRAASNLGATAALAQDTKINEEHPVVQHLRMAADHLAAGRDMLETHFTTGPFGARAGNSYWAPVITSAPVTTALLAELAAHARGLAPWAAKLSVTGPSDSGVPVSARMALHAASRWLWVAGKMTETAQRHQPPHADDELCSPPYRSMSHRRTGPWPTQKLSPSYAKASRSRPDASATPPLPSANTHAGPRRRRPPPGGATHSPQPSPATAASPFSAPSPRTPGGTVALSDPMIIGQEDLSSAGARRPPDARFSLPDGLRAYT
jgi:hypothetical protein